MALVPDPQQQGLLGREAEAGVEGGAPASGDWAAPQNWAAAGGAGEGVQAGQGLQGGLPGAERQGAGQLLNLGQDTQTY